MKRLILVLMALGFLVVNSSPASAEWFAKTDTEKTTQAAPKVVAKKKDSNKIQEMIAKKKSEINSTEWMIETKPMSGKGKSDQDVISFLDNKVVSRNMEARGYAATNYSMRLLEDNETYTWETMQISEKEGTAFWRGDIGTDGVMRGVVSIRNKKNAVTDYNFYSTESKKATVVIAEAPAVATPVQPEK